MADDPELGIGESGESGVDSLAAPAPPLAPTIARNQIEAGQTNSGDPRDWAENMVSGVQAALAGFGAAGRVNPGSGALAGVGAAARASQARRDELTLQKQRMQLAQRREMTEEQKAQAEIAYQNAQRVHIEKMSRNEDRETMQKMLETDQKFAEPYLESGILPRGEHLTSDDLARMLKPGPNGHSEINGHEVIALRDGLTDVIGPDGKPVLDEDNIPKQRPTFRLFDANGTVTLDKEQAELLGKYTPYKPAAGVPMSIPSYATLHNLALKNQTVELNIEKVKAEIGEKGAQQKKAEEETGEKQDEKALKQQAAKVFTPYLSAAHGDPWRAMQLMSKDPRNAASVGLVEQAYGPGNIDEWHHRAVEEAQKAEELKLQKAAKESFLGDENARTPGEFLASLKPGERDIVNMLHEGRLPIARSGYILARKPELIEALERAYPGEFDASKVDAYREVVSQFESTKPGTAGYAMNAGGTVLQHLAEAKAINDASPIQSRIPGTKAYVAYENKIDTVSDELAKFYGTTTIPGIEELKKTLDPSYPLASRDTAIVTQARSMGDKLNEYETTWRNAAPSRAYEAQMPQISDAGKKARAALDPNYARDKGIVPEGAVHVQIPGHPAGFIPKQNLPAFQKAHPDAVVIGEGQGQNPPPGR